MRGRSEEVGVPAWEREGVWMRLARGLQGDLRERMTIDERQREDREREFWSRVRVVRRYGSGVEESRDGFRR